MKKDLLTVIEFTDTSVKLLRASRQHEQTAVAECEIAGANDIPLNNLRNQSVRAVVIPSRYAILRQLTLPSQSSEEIRRMIGLQVGRLAPFTGDEAVFDYVALGSDAAGYTKVLAIIVPKESIYYFLKLLQKNHIAPQSITLASLGLLNWFIHRQRAERAQPGRCIMLIDVDRDNTEVCFCRDDKLFFSRNIRLGAEDLQNAPIDRFMEQVGLTLGYYWKETLGPEIKGIVLAASSPRADELGDKLEKCYEVKVEKVSPLETVDCAKGFSFPPGLQRDGVSLTRSLGFVLGEAASVINLMPAEVLDTQTSKTRHKAVIKFLLMLTLTCCLGLGVYGVEAYKGKLSLEKIEQKSREVKPQADKAREEIGALRAIERHREKRFLLADVLKELYEITPADISFDALELNSEGALSIQGYGAAGADVNLFQNQLVGSPWFSEVNLQYATKRMRFREEYIEFKIICRLSAGDGGHGL